MALIHMNFFSEVLKMSSQMEVILPQDVKSQIGAGTSKHQKKYPVLYLLHGMTDNHTTWSRHTSIERYACERGIAVVMPNGHLGWYTDMKYGYDYYTYISQEIPKLCERFFPCISNIREGRFIAGNSMGGYGAFKIALKNPEKFSGAVSLSGALDAASSAEKSKDKFYSALWEDIFGDLKSIIGSDNDIFALAQNLKLHNAKIPKLYMWCGISDSLYDQNVKAKTYLKNLGFDLVYKESEGDHSWKYWDKYIQDALDWILTCYGKGE